MPSGAHAATGSAVAPADAFVDSVGVCTHLDSPPYDRDPAALRRVVGTLGVRHLRDEVRPSNDMAAWRALHAETKARFHLLVSPVTNSVDELMVAIEALGLGAVSAVEGQNEGDSPWFATQSVSRPDWAATVVAYQRAVYAAVRRRYDRATLPVVSPSVLDYKPDDMRRLRRAAADCDIVAIHAYPQGNQEPETTEDYAGLAWYLRAFRDPFKPGAPAMATEAGYHLGEGGVTPEIAAIYLPRLLLTAFGLGYLRTFIYELMQEGPAGGDPEQGYGLLDAALRPLPAYHALRLLLQTLADPGPVVAARAATWRVLEGPDDLRLMPFARRDGSFVLAAWRAARSWDPASRRPLAVKPRPLRLAARAPSASSLQLAEGARWMPIATRDGTMEAEISDTVNLIRLAG